MYPKEGGGEGRARGGGQDKAQGTLTEGFTERVVALDLLTEGDVEGRGEAEEDDDRHEGEEDQIKDGLLHGRENDVHTGYLREILEELEVEQEEVERADVHLLRSVQAERRVISIDYTERLYIASADF